MDFGEIEQVTQEPQAEVPETPLKCTGLKWQAAGHHAELNNLVVEAGEKVAIGGTSRAVLGCIDAIVGGIERRGKSILFGQDLAGPDHGTRETWLRIGCMPNRIGWGGYTVAEIVGIHGRATRRRDNELYAQLGLKRMRGTQYSKLDGRARKLVQLYLALAHNPELLLLQSPTEDLSDDTQQRLQAWLEALPAERTAIVTATSSRDVLDGARLVWFDGPVPIEAASLSELVTRQLGDTRTSFDMPKGGHVRQIEADCSGIPGVLDVQASVDTLVIYSEGTVIEKLGKLRAKLGREKEAVPTAGDLFVAARLKRAIG